MIHQDMNKKGFIRGIITIILILVIIGLYYYTGETKEIIGMLIKSWEPVKVDLAQKSLTVQLSNITNNATAVVP